MLMFVQYIGIPCQKIDLIPPLHWPLNMCRRNPKELIENIFDIVSMVSLFQIGENELLPNTLNKLFNWFCVKCKWQHFPCYLFIEGTLILNILN